jgi:sporulation protein YlmC with PRC-barrel domain
MMPTQTNKPLTAVSASYSARHHTATAFSAVALMASLLYLAGITTAVEASEQDGRSDQKQAQQDQKTGLAHNLPPVYKISNWLGKPVNNEAGEQIGTIRDMIMDDYGRFRYVIMESEQVADEYKGDRIAVPMNHFQYPDEDGERYMVLDATPAKVSEAPSFEAGTYPNLPLRRWESVVVAYWLPEDAKDANPPKDRDDVKAKTPESVQQSSENNDGGGSEQASLPFDGNRDMVYLPDAKEQLFDKLDANDDAAITKDEAKAHPPLAKEFERIDSYDNGRVTRSEFALFELEASGSKQAGKSN